MFAFDKVAFKNQSSTLIYGAFFTMSKSSSMEVFINFQFFIIWFKGFYLILSDLKQKK